MRADRIEVDPFYDLSVIDYKGVKQVNEHGVITLKGNIPIEKIQEYFSTADKIELVKITATEVNGEAKTLIYGYLTECDISVEGHLAIMTIQVKTGTCKMEHSKHTRTFQSEDITYDAILDICNQPYHNSDKIVTCGSGVNIPEFIVQYNESDWVFIKRLASYVNTVIIPDTLTGGVKYYFGFPRFDKKQIPQAASYRMGRDMEDYERKKALGLNLTETDCDFYIVTTRELYELGNRVDYLGRELYIYRIESRMQGSELYHDYYLKSARGLSTTRRYNGRMTGASLPGTVRKTENDKVQLTIAEDENKTHTGARWFAFATVYSSPDGTGWYCMPESGDTVRLCFPTECAQDAYVSSAVHEYSNERVNPELKFLRNRHGKEICLAPDRITLTNNNGTSIEISDRAGIRLKSRTSISLQADNKISITSQNADVRLNASTGIKLKQRDSVLKIKDDITFEGRHVKLH